MAQRMTRIAQMKTGANNTLAVPLSRELTSAPGFIRAIRVICWLENNPDEM